MTEQTKPINGIQSRRARRRPIESTQEQSRTGIPAHYAWLLIAVVVGIISYYIYINPNHKSSQTLILASLVLVVSCLPMFWFLIHGRFYQVPALEAHCLFYAIAFGFAGFLPIPLMSSAMSVDEDSLVTALRYTLLGLSALLAGYYLIGPKLMKSVRPIQISQGISPAKLEGLGWSGCILGALVHQGGQNTSIFIVGQLGGDVYTLGFFLLLTLVLERRASFLTSVMAILLLLPLQLILNSGLNSGQLAGTVTLACWISLVVFRTMRRIPILLLAGAFVFFIIFQPVKFYVRTLAWEEGVQLGPVETIKVYADGFRQVYGSTSAMMANSKENFDSSFDRINHLATTAAIIRDTPSAQPFLWGESYLPLLTKWIPRIIWHGKPEERLGNGWASRYGYLGQNDSTTSYNLPWLPEMYMNFGWPGVVGVMFLLGILFRYLWFRLMAAAEGPGEYAVAIVFAQSLVFAESNLSLMIGNIVIFAVTLWVILFGLRFFGVYEMRPIRSQRYGPESYLAEQNFGKTES
jgi:hypothetical protein